MFKFEPVARVSRSPKPLLRLGYSNIVRDRSGKSSSLRKTSKRPPPVPLSKRQPLRQNVSPNPSSQSNADQSTKPKSAQTSPSEAKNPLSTPSPLLSATPHPKITIFLLQFTSQGTQIAFLMKGILLPVSLQTPASWSHASWSS